MFYTHFCTMKHRGEIVKSIIDSKGIAKSHVAQAIGYTREHMYNLFSDPDLDYDIIRKIGRFIGYDFTLDFTDMPIYDMVQEPEGTYLTVKNMTGSECLQRYSQLWERYTKLLEDYKEISDKMRILEYKLK